MDSMRQLVRQQARLERNARQSKRGAEPGAWVAFPTTWTYASATTFTIADPGEGHGADDFTSHIQAGDFIRFKQGGAYLYFMITAVAYSDPTTTVTVTKYIPGGGSDIANAAITDNYYSKAYSPQGCGPAGQVLIAASVLSSGDGTFSFTTIPGTYNHLVLMGPLRSDDAALDDEVHVQVNNDSGAADYAWTRASLRDGGKLDGGDEADSVLELGYIEGNTASASLFSPWKATFHNYADTTIFKGVLAECVNGRDLAAGTSLYRSIAGGYRLSTTAISRIDVFPNAGTNFKQYSSLYLYGVT